MEISINYSKEYADGGGHTYIKTPLIPVKVQLRSFKDRKEGYDRIIFYFRYSNEWVTRLHMDIEELVAFERKIGNVIAKAIQDGRLPRFNEKLRSPK